jgi:hypothetical protein
MIKRQQHMFSNDILVKINELCEKPDNKSADFTEFHGLKINIEDQNSINVFNQNSPFLQKKIQNIFEGCLLESLFTFIRPFHLLKVVAVSVYEKHLNKNHF